MRYKPGQKEETRKRILAAVGRCFKEGGYSGVGVDGLAKEAGVTSGAFYGHFDSKKDAFAAAIVSGMDELKQGIISCQQEYGDKWWTEFASFYMNQKRTCDLTESCTLQSLTPDVYRSDEVVRSLFEAELLKIVKQADEGVEGALKSNQQHMDRTWANLAMLIGGVTLARAVTNEEVSNEIAVAIQNVLKNE